MDRPDLDWSSPVRGNVKPLHYVHRQNVSMTQALMLEAGIDSELLDFSGPIFPDIGIDKPYIVVRPATVRAEWRADARNPSPEYLAKASQAAIDAGFTVVSVADLEDGKEWTVGELPPATIRYHKGELSVEQLLGLVQHASGLIGGVGWVVPAAVAYQVPLLLIYGGAGLHNAPERLFDRRMVIAKITQAIPDRFCRCHGKQHSCDLTITDFNNYITRFINTANQ